MIDDCGPDSRSGGGIEGEFEMSQVRGVRRGQRPDRPRYIRWQGPSSSGISSLFYTNYSKSKIFRSVLNFLGGRDFFGFEKVSDVGFF